MPRVEIDIDWNFSHSFDETSTSHLSALGSRRAVAEYPDRNVAYHEAVGRRHVGDDVLQVQRFRREGSRKSLEDRDGHGKEGRQVRNALIKELQRVQAVRLRHQRDELV